MPANSNHGSGDRRIAVAVLVLACALGALFSARGSGRACAPIVGIDGAVTFRCEPAAVR